MTERIEAGRRERRVLARVSRAAWRLAQAERERAWALVSARAEGISIRPLASAAGLSSTRVHQLVTGADLDALDAALGELRMAGWPAPEGPDIREDTELDGRNLSADRLGDEVDWLRRCAGWLEHLQCHEYPPAVNLRPAGDWPGTAHVVVDLARIRAILERIAADVGELARARRVEELDTAAVRPDRRAGDAGAWPNRIWTSASSAPARSYRCPPGPNWSEPGMPGRPNGIGAARAINGPTAPTTHFVHTDARAFSRLNAVTVLTVRLLPTPLIK